MFDKKILINKVITILQDNRFETFITHGSFDIVGKREYLILIKALLNIDALEEKHALDLRAISYFLSAYPLVISQRNNREHLDDNIVYSRFEVPVMTPRLFKSMLEDEEVIVTQSSKGRYTKEINIFALKERRKELGLTLEELARQVGISKKAMYEIENKRVNPQENTVKRLESILRIDLTLPYEMKYSQAIYLKPKTHFQRNVSMEFTRIGIDNSSLNSTPFEVIGKESFSLITSLSEKPGKTHEIFEIKQLSEILSSKPLIISKKTTTNSVEGVPIISESELNELHSSQELIEMINERT